MKKTICCITLILAAAAGIVLGWLTMKAPSTYKSDRYSVENARNDVEFISLEPHTVRDRVALERVRNYLTDRLSGMGLSPEIISYGTVLDPLVDEPVEVINILAVLPGDFNSYALLVAHYDSSPKKRSGEEEGSCGAADDGYGLSTILEVTRLIMEDAKEKPLVNGIKILFTDCEETSLYGALFSANDPRVTDKVSCVFNLETRGIRGPVVLFENTENNKKVIELFRHAEYPFTYSLATDVYRIMPNSTDFTHFVEAGFSGYNFGCLETLEYYHTPKDNFSNISLNTMSHYGNIIYPILREFTSSPAYSDINWAKSDRDTIIFTILPGVLVVYSPLIGYILLGVLAILSAAVLFLLASRKLLSKSLKWVVIWLGLILAAAVFGLAVSFVVSLLTGVKFSPTYMPRVPFADGIVLLSGLFVAAALGWLTFRSVRKSPGKAPALLAGGVLLQLLLTALLTFFLPGGSFLFLFTGILFALTALLRLVMKSKVFAQAAAVFSVFYTALLFAPLLMMLNIALTIGALAVILLIETSALSAALPAAIWQAYKEP